MPGQGLRRPAWPAGLIDAELRQCGVPGPHPARHLPVPDERVPAKLGAVALGEVEHPVGVREVEASRLGLDVLPLELVAGTERVEVLSEEAPRARIGERTGLGAEGRHLGPEGNPMTVRRRSRGGAGQGEHQGELGGEGETNPHRGPPSVVARNPVPRRGGAPVPIAGQEARTGWSRPRLLAVYSGSRRAPGSSSSAQGRPRRTPARGTGSAHCSGSQASGADTRVSARDERPPRATRPSLIHALARPPQLALVPGEHWRTALELGVAAPRAAPGRKADLLRRRPKSGQGWCASGAPVSHRFGRLPAVHSGRVPA